MTAKVCILFVLLFTGCSYLPPIPYRIDVQQGNVVTDEMIEMLKPGMTKSQVLFVMGSPLIVDAFRENRWDYVYSMKPSGEDAVEKKAFLVFKTKEDGIDRLVGMYGDFKPSNLPVVKPSEEQTVDLPKREVDHTLWEIITGLFGFEGSDDSSAPKNAPKSQVDLPL